jgi:hypothetical protein
MKEVQGERSMTERYLTKSRFKLAMECPTKLFYTGKSKTYKNTKGENEFLESLAEGGFQVGKMASMLYPNGIEVQARKNQQAIDETKKLLNTKEDLVLFEPAFAYDGLLVRVDIFTRQGSSIELIEVKSKSYDSEDPNFFGNRTPIKSGILPYIEDIAFQKYVVSKAFQNADVKAFFMMPDKAVKAKTDGLNQCFRISNINGLKTVNKTSFAEKQVQANSDLLKKVPVDKYIDIIMENPLKFPGSRQNSDDYLPQRSAIWSKAYQDDIKIDTEIHNGCKNCEFKSAANEPHQSGFHDCMMKYTNLSQGEIDKGTVLDIWRYRRKEELIEAGIFKIDDAKNYIDVKPIDEGLSYTERQMLQVAGIPADEDKGGFYFDTDYFRRVKNKWSYPFHFIDFETCTVALPFFKGMRPYESIAFQFSHHVMHENGEVEHRNQSLIAEPGQFPNFNFVRELKKSLDADSGTIFRWAAHENTILNQIKQQLLTHDQTPEDCDNLIKFIETITNDATRAMVDLNEIAVKCYFHPETQGRTSIKKVLPAVMKTSKSLKKEYSKPIGVNSSSLNFPQSFIWFQESDKVVVDPYELLKRHTIDLFNELNSNISHENYLIAEGGAAAMAYARLQFEELNTRERRNINDALLRYCELDTLAMAMILRAWIDWCENHSVEKK